MLFWNADPVPSPPMPGISPAQATPLHTGHTRHAPLNFSRAVCFKVFQSIVITSVCGIVSPYTFVPVAANSSPDA